MGTCQTAVNMAGASCDSKAATMPDCDRRLGLFCSRTTNTCVAYTYADDGQPCGVVAGGFAACNAGGLCVLAAGATMGTCKAAVADGQACDDTNGPPCVVPAKCVAGVCTLGNAAACPGSTAATR